MNRVKITSGRFYKLHARSNIAFIFLRTCAKQASLQLALKLTMLLIFCLPINQMLWYFPFFFFLNGGYENNLLLNGCHGNKMFLCHQILLKTKSDLVIQLNKRNNRWHTCVSTELLHPCSIPWSQLSINPRTADLTSIFFFKLVTTFHWQLLMLPMNALLHVNLTSVTN